MAFRIKAVSQSSKNSVQKYVLGEKIRNIPIIVHYIAKFQKGYEYFVVVSKGLSSGCPTKIATDNEKLFQRKI